MFENWIFLKPTFLKFWKKSPKLFIILASHMESFILGSECDHIFFLFFYNIPKWNESTLIKSCNFHSKFKFVWTKSTAALKQRTSLLLWQNKVSKNLPGLGEGMLVWSLYFIKSSAVPCKIIFKSCNCCIHFFFAQVVSSASRALWIHQGKNLGQRHFKYIIKVRWVCKGRSRTLWVEKFHFHHLSCLILSQK